MQKKCLLFFVFHDIFIVDNSGFREHNCKLKYFETIILQIMIFVMHSRIFSKISILHIVDVLKKSNAIIILITHLKCFNE